MEGISSCLSRYEILTVETSPRSNKFGPNQLQDAVKHILRQVWSRMLGCAKFNDDFLPGVFRWTRASSS